MLINNAVNDRNLAEDFMDSVSFLHLWRWNIFFYLPIWLFYAQNEPEIIPQRRDQPE